MIEKEKGVSHMLVNLTISGTFSCGLQIRLNDFLSSLGRTFGCTSS